MTGKDLFKYYNNFKKIIIRNSKNKLNAKNKKEIHKIIYILKNKIKTISKTKISKKDFDKLYIIGLELLIIEKYLSYPKKLLEYLKGMNSKSNLIFEKYEKKILQTVKKKKKIMKGGYNKYISQNERVYYECQIVDAILSSCGSYKPYYSNGDFTNILFKYKYNQQTPQYVINKAHITINTSNLNESNIQSWLKSPKTTYKINITEEKRRVGIGKQKTHFFGKKLFMYKESVSRYLENKKINFDNINYEINESDRGIHKYITERFNKMSSTGGRILPYNKNENVLITKIQHQNGNIYLIVHKTDDDIDDLDGVDVLEGDVKTRDYEDSRRERDSFFERADEIVYNKKKDSLVQFLPEDGGVTKNKILKKYDDYTRVTRNMPLYHIKYTAKLFKYIPGDYEQVYKNKKMKDVYEYYSIRDISDGNNLDFVKKIKEIKKIINYFLINKYQIDTPLFNNLMYYFQYPKPSNRLIIHIEYINPIQVLHHQQYKLDNMYLFDDVLNNLKQDPRYYLNDVIGMKYKFMLDIHSPGEKYKNIVQDLREDFIFNCKRFLLVLNGLFNFSLRNPNYEWSKTHLKEKESSRHNIRDIYFYNGGDIFQHIKNILLNTNYESIFQNYENIFGNFRYTKGIPVDGAFLQECVELIRNIINSRDDGEFYNNSKIFLLFFQNSKEQLDNYFNKLKNRKTPSTSTSTKTRIRTKIARMSYLKKVAINFWNISKRDDLKIILEYFFDFGEIGYWNDKFENVFNKSWIKKENNTSKNLLKCKVQTSQLDEEQNEELEEKKNNNVETC